MAFESHLEYINHITCQICKYYWTHATMDPKFEISRGEYHCPCCGRKGAVHQEDHRITIEKENFFSGGAESETTTDWFPDNELSQRSVYSEQPQLPNLCLCEGIEDGRLCSCEELE